jgi:hypothetical protein
MSSATLERVSSTGWDFRSTPVSPTFVSAPLAGVDTRASKGGGSNNSESKGGHHDS